MSAAARRWLSAGFLVAAVAGGLGMADLPAAGAREAGHTTSCPEPTVPVPAEEPSYRAGPQQLVSGLYIQGGAVPPPPCKPEPRGPYAGRLTVRRSGTGQVVASRTVKDGHLAHICLTAGSYELRGRMQNGPRLGPVRVTVRPGQTVRQDVFEDVP